MSKVITFSQKFPSYHPKKGEPTYFVEKIWKGLPIEGEYSIWQKHPKLMKNGLWHIPHVWRDKMLDDTFKPKYHTIRAGNRFKAGEYFSPRIWSGVPRKSKQIIIAPDIKIEKVWDFEMIPSLWIDECTFTINKSEVGNSLVLYELAENDGLTINDFLYWFGEGKEASSKRKPFTGQIICWSKNINY